MGASDVSSADSVISTADPTTTTSSPTDTPTVGTDVTTTPTTTPTDSPTIGTASTTPTDSPTIGTASTTPTTTPTDNGTITTTPTTTPTDINTTTPTTTPPLTSTPDAGNSTTTPEVTSPTTTSDTIVTTPTETPTLAPTLTPSANLTTIPATTERPSPSVPLTNTIKPTGTDSATALTPESSIISATSTASSSSSKSTSSAAVIPTSLPRVIQPPGGADTAPQNSTLIQIGFNYGLNYAFVVSSQTAVSQIFSYLPPGIGHGIDQDSSDVIMQYLQPYNTLNTLDYITTLAMAYIPSEMVNALSVNLLNPNSDLYSNPNPSVATLMSMIDPSIPILPGSAMQNSGTPI